MAQPVIAEIDELVALMERLVEIDWQSLPGSVQLACTEALLRSGDRIDYVISQAINALWSSEATVDLCGQTVKGWLRDQHLSDTDAGSRVATARQLLEREQVAAAFKAGEISLDHAKTLTQTLRGLPEELQEVAEKELTDAAKFVDPATLGRASRDLKDHLGLNGTAEERYAKLYGQRYLKTAGTIDGMVKLDAMLDSATGAALKAALASLSVRQGSDDERTKAQRDHDALGMIVAFALRTGDLPDNGGTPPQVIVTVPLDELINGLDPMRSPLAGLDGHLLPASVVRMKACDAGIIPAVLGGESEVLDLGRSSRTWNKAQRTAARLRDGETCTWPGKCTIPIRYCELHHIEHWAEHQGPSNHHNSAHLCTFHHWLIHNRQWKLWREPSGALQCRRT